MRSVLSSPTELVSTVSLEKIPHETRLATKILTQVLFEQTLTGFTHFPYSSRLARHSIGLTIVQKIRGLQNSMP